MIKHVTEKMSNSTVHHQPTETPTFADENGMPDQVVDYKGGVDIPEHTPAD